MNHEKAAPIIDFDFSVSSSVLSRLFCKPLKAFENMLAGYGFFRASRSYIIRLLEIQKIKDNTLLIKNGLRINISTAKKKELISALADNQDYLFS